MDTPFKSSILTELKWRGLIEDQTHAELDEALAQGPVTLYAGFDPSAASLHVGNLVPMMGLAFFRRHGHNVIALAGGATGRIGDPSGKSQERDLKPDSEIEANLAGISAQLERILGRALELHPETLHLDPTSPPRDIVFANNNDWIAPWSFIDFLRDVGKHFRVNAMIAKDSIRTRLSTREQGISYTEFSYMLIQAYDFLHLSRAHRCTLQIGGSDQWGNITAGTDLIRRTTGADAFGMTMPLLTKADGTKFGKSEDGSVWLDPEWTSPYAFYQYWLNTNDADLPRLLRTFTFLPQEEINAHLDEVAQGNNRGQVQRALAFEVTSLIHGEEATHKAIRASRVLFGESIEGLDDRDLGAIFKDVPSTTLSRDALNDGISVVDLLVRSGLAASNGAARKLIKQGGAYVNNARVTDAQRTVTDADLASATMMVLRSGKKTYHLLRFEA